MVNEQDQNTSSKTKNQAPESVQQYPTATFAGGCFWGVEYNFGRVPGVLDTQVGFMGGRVDNPSYKEVCYEDTNHAEVVHMAYNPEKVSYEQLAKIFFKLHDPTTLNRQGPDVGTQYRSAIFYHTPEQKQIAEKVKAQLNASGEFKRPIVTEITQADAFWKAEDYHQQYIEKNPLRRCHVVDFNEIKKILNETE
ncbi:MAG: peptide-methionine (S)-S-oxide reductase MsrA [Planctomycetes bacterium]|nr:peptide-methionine (S)-S-oxide reductase MsrA [Planctomycetota bacterium]